MLNTVPSDVSLWLMKYYRGTFFRSLAISLANPCLLNRKSSCQLEDGINSVIWSLSFYECCYLVCLFVCFWFVCFQLILLIFRVGSCHVPFKLIGNANTSDICHVYSCITLRNERKQQVGNCLSLLL